MSDFGKILVTGATGNVSSAAIQYLVGLGANVRALVRDESKAQSLKDAGVEVVVGDLMRPETLDAAFAGVDKVFLLTPIGPDAATMARNGIASAKRTGNPHIVRLSESSPEPVSALRNGRLHAQVNEELEASGLRYASLRPTFYMQNTMLAAQTVASDGMVYMPFKDGKLGMIDIRDVAEAATKVLTSAGHEGKTYVLTGPESISFHDVARGLSKALGKEVKYVNVPLAAARETMIGMGLPGWGADAFCEYFHNFSEGGGDMVTDDVERLLGKPARSYETFARDFAQMFGGH